MKKFLFSVLILGLLTGACAPAAQPAAPTPLSDADLQGTANAIAQQTLQAIPAVDTPTPPPTITPVVLTATNTEAPTEAVTPTETQNSALLTLTATLSTGAPTSTTGPASATGTPAVPSATLNPLTPTETLYPRHYDTIPNDYPRGTVNVINKAKVEMYISMQMTTQEGLVWIDEYPVEKSIEVIEPVGKYFYVVWVGGNKLMGNFKLGRKDYVTIKVFKDKVEIVQK